jgi:gliding motility-associated-like protein
MKQLFLSLFLISFLFSCKKEKPYNADEHITYTHWYKLKSISNDTLFAVYIPNAFSPNGDGYNEQFGPVVNTYSSGLVYSFEVFDKNNTTVFKSSDINARWDGKANGQGNTLAIDSYTYKFKITDNTTVYEYTGSVLLFK